MIDAPLALASVGAEQSLLDKIMTNLSKRARETLKDELEFQSIARGDAEDGHEPDERSER